MKNQNARIQFVLKVKATPNGDGRYPIDLSMDLNPKDKLLGINDKLSSKAELITIFKQIIELIDNLDERAGDYTKVININREAMRKQGFTENAINGDYDNNFNLPFEKISKIIYSHRSPGNAAVSYARSHNGDKPPML
jgi:hypothetical protein